MHKKLMTLILVTLLIIAFASAVVQAYTVAFTYEGWGIRGKASLSSTYVTAGTTVKIVHHQEMDWPVGDGMNVAIQRQLWWGWLTVHTQYCDGDGTFTFYKSLTDTDIYRLFFTSVSDQSYQSWYILGSFQK